MIGPRNEPQAEETACRPCPHYGNSPQTFKGVDADQLRTACVDERRKSGSNLKASVQVQFRPIANDGEQIPHLAQSLDNQKLAQPLAAFCTENVEIGFGT